MIYTKYIGALLLGITTYVSAHSWIACADYRGDVNYYDDSKCFGYVRNWERGRGGVPEALAPHPKGYNMAVDTGFEHRPSESNACQYPMASPISAAYTPKYPPPVYEQGGVYCLAWPTKNHAAATCTNQYIPDTDLRLFISSVNPSSDPSMSQFELRNINGIDSCRGSRSTECQLGKSKHQKGSIDCQGFQRAPKFCDNTDKAMGHGCFRVPSDLPRGRYIFQWRWEFNVGELYTSCWDVDVVAAGQAPNHGPHGTTGTPQSNMCSSGNCGCANNYPAIAGGGNQAPAPAPSPQPQPTPRPQPQPTPSPQPTPRPQPQPQPTPRPQPQPSPAPQPQPQPQPSPSPHPSGKKCIYETECAHHGCGAGLTCIKHKYWSQCLEPEGVRNKNGCTRVNNWGCREKGCCNPAARCTDDNLCKLPCQK